MGRMRSTRTALMMNAIKPGSMVNPSTIKISGKNS